MDKENIETEKMSDCDSHDIGLKSFFLGPGSENREWVNHELVSLWKRWFNWREEQLDQFQPVISAEDQANPEFIANQEKFSSILHELIRKFESEIPNYSPHYVGHMISETSLPGLFGHIIALLHNPNNISNEISKVGAILEREGIIALQKMVGYDPFRSFGHFTSGGTLANIEAVWRARHRMDRWLSLGAYQKKHGIAQGYFVELAMRGWDDFDHALGGSGIEEESLKPYNFFSNSPWSVVHLYEKIFKEPCKGPVVLVPGSKHYSWQKAISLLSLGEDAFWTISLDNEGRLSIPDLRKKINEAISSARPVLMVVSVGGTTELGEVDPVGEVQDVLDEYQVTQGWHIWHHVDAAYGGFFASMLGERSTAAALSDKVISSLKAICRADSVTLDPHKLGYIPYACGALLVRDHDQYAVPFFEAPYIGGYQKNHNYQGALEGSRPATGASATWLSSRVIGFHPDGFGRLLRRTIHGKNQLKKDLMGKWPNWCHTLAGDDLNILCFFFARSHERLSDVNARSNEIYSKLPMDNGFYVSKTELFFENYPAMLNDCIQKTHLIADQKGLTVLRVVLMNPFFTSKEYQPSLDIQFISHLEKTLNSIKEDNLVC